MNNETLTDREVLLLRRKLDLLLRTGELLMASAADTNRIDRNMKRVAAFMGIPEEKLVLRGSGRTEEIPLEALLREYKGTLDQI